MATMNFVAFSLTLLVAAVVSGGPAWKETTIQRGGGLKIGTTHVNGRNVSAPRGTGIKVGSGVSGRTFRSTTTATTPLFEEFFSMSSSLLPTAIDEIRPLYVGMVVPHTSFGRREYIKAFQNTKRELQKKLLKMFNKYDLKMHIAMKELVSNPTVSVVPVANTANTSTNTRLPQIQLSLFDGKFANWNQYLPTWQKTIDGKHK